MTGNQDALNSTKSYVRIDTEAMVRSCHVPKFLISRLRTFVYL